MLKLRRFALLLILLLIVTSMLCLTLAVNAQDSTAANLVYGQPDFTSNAPNQGAQPSATTLNFPLGIVRAPDGFYVADRNNHRVLFFADDNDTTADRVYGQFDSFTSYIINYDGVGGSGLPSANNLHMPTVVAVAPDGGLYVADRDNHRILYFASDGDSTADRVYGQFGFFDRNPVNNDGVGGSGTPGPDTIGVFTLGLIVDSDGGLYVADASNNRILYFADDGDTTADRVYGHNGSFTSGVKNDDGTGVTGSPSADSLNFPRGLALDLNGLYVADRENHRVLYFAHDGYTTADRVYGQQGSFTTGAPNLGGDAPTADTLSSPRAVAVDGAGGLYIADANNHRVLYFAPDGDTTADAVYGQFGSMTTGVMNNDGSGATGAPGPANLSGPQGVALGPNGILYVSDTQNNRVLVFDAVG